MNRSRYVVIMCDCGQLPIALMGDGEGSGVIMPLRRGSVDIYRKYGYLRSLLLKG